MIEFMQVGAAFLYMFVVFVVSALCGYAMQIVSEIFNFEYEIPWYYAAYVAALIACAVSFYRML